jgi:hypothetical protein
VSKPTASQLATSAHETLTNKALCPVPFGFGLFSTVQVDPDIISVNVPEGEYPTAIQALELEQLTPSRTPSCVAPVTMVHTEPFHCSMSGKLDPERAK